MHEDVEDWDAWNMYPQHRWLFNKLELSLRLGYCAGPTPAPVPVTGDYIVRPIYNLSGMGAGAVLMNLEAGRVYDFPPSYFWCERFVGDHISVNYKWEASRLIPTHTSLGETDFNNLSRFKRWIKIEHRNLELPNWISSLRFVDDINIEFIDGKIIEIHLRQGIDFPEGASEIIPIWQTTSQADIALLENSGYKFIESYTDAEKNILDARCGFFWK